MAWKLRLWILTGSGLAALLLSALALTSIPIVSTGGDAAIKIPSPVPMVAITFDDELVYWIHMGANFSETVDIEYVSPDMRY